MWRRLLQTANLKLPPILRPRTYLDALVKTGLVFALMAISWCASAQVCTGSLGDPVVNVDFGKGGNPGARLPGAVTNYNYVPTDCPQDGNYAILNATYNCHGSTWHDIPEDHTPGDANGYMMVVNASYTPGDFYLDTVKGLCPNTTYEFASWIVNLSRPSSCGGSPIKPNLTFNIETTTGTVLSTYNTAAIDYTPFPQWRQFGVFFTTPASVGSVVLRLTNNAPGGCGNDLALDDITFRPCGPTIQAAFTSNTAKSIGICEGQQAPQYDLTSSVSSGYSNPVYQWQRSVDSSLFTDIAGAVSLVYQADPVKPGRYRYRLAVAQAGNSSVACRIVSNELTVQIYPTPVVNASANNPVCEDSPLKLAASGGSQYAWSGPNGFSALAQLPTFSASLNSSGTYYLEVTSVDGCKNTDSVKVNVFPKASVAAGADQTICEGLAIALNGSLAAAYRWSPAKGLSATGIRNPIARPADTTTYVLTITDNNGCQRSDSLTINVLKKPLAEAGPEKQIFEGQSATLDGSAKGTGIRYSWSPATSMTNANTLQPVVAPADNTTYTLSVISDVGCGAAQDQVFVCVFKKVAIPNAFSPNGDGINDDWNILYLQTYTQAVVTVFNRYGQQVFTSNGYNKKWNGTVNGNPLPAGTYYYMIDRKNGLAMLNGWLLIVR